MNWEYRGVRCTVCGWQVFSDTPLLTAEQHEREHHQGRIVCVLFYSHRPPRETP